MSSLVHPGQEKLLAGYGDASASDGLAKRIKRLVKNPIFLGAVFLLTVVLFIVLGATGQFKKGDKQRDDPPTQLHTDSGEPPVEYEGFTSETYKVYYDDPRLGAAMQACGVINDPHYVKDGQCAVFFEEGAAAFCTPFFTQPLTSCTGCKQSTEEPTCTGNSLTNIVDNVSDDPIVLFRSNGALFSTSDSVFFAATATEIHLYGKIISVFTGGGPAGAATITGASVPFTHDCCPGNTYAVVTTNLGPFGAHIYNLNSGEAAFLYHGSSWDYTAHAAAVGEFGNGDLTIALLYDADAQTSFAAGQYLGFYDDLADTTLALAGGCTLVDDDEITACPKQNTARQVVKVFPNYPVEPTPNNADLVFDSTHSYVLVTLGNLFALVSVPTDDTPAKVLESTTSAYNSNELGFKAAFGPAPPAGSVRPQLFVVALDIGVVFLNVNDPSFDKQVFFTPDGTLDDSGFGDVYSKNNFPDFTTEKILGVEWSSPEEVIVYRERSLQKVTVPGAVLMAYRGYNSLTYPQYYTGTADGVREAWPLDADNKGAPAMQACGVINTPAVLKNGQCAVFSSGDEFKICTPFQHLATGNIEATPGCTGKKAPDKTPILFRVDGTTASFAATATHIYPQGEGAIDIPSIVDSYEIISMSMPFVQNDNTYAIVSGNFATFVFNLADGRLYELYGYMPTGFPPDMDAHAAAVTDIGGVNNILAASLYSSDGKTHLCFYNWLPSVLEKTYDTIACTHNVEVFPTFVPATPNNADLAFDSTNSYVLVTLGNLFALVAVPKDGKAAETPLFTITTTPSSNRNCKAAFAPPPPSGGGVRPPQLFVVATSLSVGFYDVTATGARDGIDAIVFTSDGTFEVYGNAVFAGLPSEDGGVILGVEWSTPDEVIVYRKNSLQIVKVPDAVKQKYNGVEMVTYESLYNQGASWDDVDYLNRDTKRAWPANGVVNHAACPLIDSVDINDCEVALAEPFFKANANLMMTPFCGGKKVNDDSIFKITAGPKTCAVTTNSRNIIHLEISQKTADNDGYVFKVTSRYQRLNLPGYSYFLDDLDPTDVTGASDVWQDGTDFYALITTTTDVAIYDLKDKTKIEVRQGSGGDAFYAAAAVTYNEVTTAAASVYDFTVPADDGGSKMILIVLRKVEGLTYDSQSYVLTRGATNTKSNTLAFDTTGNYLLATFDKEWVLVDTSQSAVDLIDDAIIIHSGTATSNAQVAFSPSPTTFTTASGGTIADGIFKQLYVVATKDKLEWYSVDVDQAETLLGFIDGLNTAGDDIVSVQWLTQHEVVLFRSTSGRQHVPVPGKVFNGQG